MLIDLNQKLGLAVLVIAIILAAVYAHFGGAVQDPTSGMVAGAIGGVCAALLIVVFASSEDISISSRIVLWLSLLLAVLLVIYLLVA